MATSLSSRPHPPAAQQNLQDALATFRGVLNDDQRKLLWGMRDVPNVDDIMMFTAELDYTQRTRKGRSFSSRLYSLLSSVGSFCAIVDTYVSAHPDIAALVWGSIKLAIMITMNFVSYYDATSELFMKLGRQCPLISEYQALFPESTRLQKSIHNFYASIIRCCKHVVETIQRPWHTQLVKALRMSFDQEFKPDLEDIENLSKLVHQEISLAKAQADSRHQQHQMSEQHEAAKNRSLMDLFFSQTDHKLHKLQSGQVQRQSREQRRLYLKSLSTYDYMRSFKQHSQKRYGDTADWVLEVPQFQRWLDGKGSVLWCSGKIGSGKSVVTASVIQHILRLKGDQKSSIGPVSFFFVQSDNEESMSADNVLRSLLRQRLEGVELPPMMQGRSAPAFSDISDLFIQHMPSQQKSFIIIDGLDECDKNRKELLKDLSVLCSSDKNIQIFLASRWSLRDEIQKHFTDFEHLTLDCEAMENDISKYVKGILNEKLEEGDFKIGDYLLLDEIQSKIIQGADGMFLWAFFQLETIFSLHCDEDIRHALDDLPKGLAETFQRALCRIENGQHGHAARKVFPWIAASKRPLSLGELREATAIEVGQQFTIPARFFNDMEKIASWCQNLVFIDEESQFVQFTHLAVKMFLLDKSAKSMLKDFHLNLKEADHMLGEICVTYLNFNDFQRTVANVARRPKAVAIDPSQILPKAFKPGSIRAAIASSLKPSSQTRPHDMSSITGPARDSPSSIETLEATHPFLKYASVHWISHSATFQETKSKTWISWKDIVIEGHPLAENPWQGKLPDNKDDILHWSYQCSHYGIFRLLISHYGLTDAQQSQIYETLTEDNNFQILEILLQGVQNQQFDYVKNRAFLEAAKSGHLETIDKLLAIKAAVNTRSSDGRTILQIAAEMGHLKVVDKLLTAEADVNAQGGDYGNALQAASHGGYQEVVQLLLDKGADVNAQGGDYGNALQAASHGGYQEVVQLLLDKGADVNAQGGDYGNALQAASHGGSQKVVQLLLDKGADVNTQGGFHNNPLQAASSRGYRDIVQLLLNNGADVNAQGGNYGNALQAASYGGYQKVVQLLLDKGADVNTQGGFRNNPLLAASNKGYRDIVQLLLDKGADVNAQDALYGNALYAASSKGHREIVQLLVDYGANVNAQGGYHGNALSAASQRGHREIVQLLLDNKADYTV